MSPLLREGEQNLLEHKSGNARVTLTNERIIIEKKQGIFNVSWVFEKEIALEDIEEAYVDPGKFSGVSRLNLKLKKGETLALPITLSNTEDLWSAFAEDPAGDFTFKHKALQDRWATAINNQILKRISKPSETENTCPKCGKKLPQGELVFCPFCATPIGKQDWKK